MFKKQGVELSDAVVIFGIIFTFFWGIFFGKTSLKLIEELKKL